MSENELGLPSVDEAYATLREQVYAPVFFSKLASYGIVPQTQAEHEELAQLAERLRNVAGSEKTASGSGRFGEALGALDQLIEDAPLPSSVASQVIKQAAAQATTDPSIYESVLSLLVNAAS